MERKSFKGRLERMVREVREEAEAFAVPMGFAVNRGLARAINRERAWWTGQGCYGVFHEDLESATPEQLRVECLQALSSTLSPLSCSHGSVVLDWAEEVDEEMAVLRRWAEKAASPPPAKELAVWAASYEALEAARERERDATAKRLQLEKELEQKAARCRAAKATTAGLRLVRRAAA